MLPNCFNCRYEQRDSIGAIVHTHSPSILAFAISRKLPTVDTFVHVHRFLGGIASVPYCICGGKELVGNVTVC